MRKELEGKGIGQVYGLANCHVCKTLLYDYWFVEDQPHCEGCISPTIVRRVSVASLIRIDTCLSECAVLFEHMGQDVQAARVDSLRKEFKNILG